MERRVTITAPEPRRYTPDHGPSAPLRTGYTWATPVPRTEHTCWVEAANTAAVSSGGYTRTPATVTGWHSPVGKSPTWVSNRSAWADPPAGTGTSTEGPPARWAGSLTWLPAGPFTKDTPGYPNMVQDEPAVLVNTNRSPRCPAALS